MGGLAGVVAGAAGLAAGTATEGVAGAVGLAVLGATDGDAVAGVASESRGVVDFGVAEPDGEPLAGDAWESRGVATASGCGVGADEGEAWAVGGWAAAGGTELAGGTAAAASWRVESLAAAGGSCEAMSAERGGTDAREAVAIDAGFRASAAWEGPEATTAKPTRGSTARVRREPAEGRNTILRGLAPAMEGGRLVRQCRKSG